MVYSKFCKYQFDHIRQVFQRCRENGTSLNPRKSIFGVTNIGKLLGHIFSKIGVSIEP